MSQTADTTHETLLDAQNQSKDFAKRYERIQSTYAEVGESSRELEDTRKQLKPLRPPTAPVDDLTRERQLILQGPGIDILVVQIALFLAVLSLVSFLVLSRDMAQGISFLLLCTGVALGFFLRK